ncbi:MAG: hypothetical protein AB1898_26620 [Acidobacteriota bacterium]
MESMETMGNHRGSNETRDLLLALGGVALMAFGAGLVMCHPVVKRYLENLGINEIVGGAIPDLERYLKLRSM